MLDEKRLTKVAETALYLFDLKTNLVRVFEKGQRSRIDVVIGDWPAFKLINHYHFDDRLRQKYIFAAWLIINLDPKKRGSSVPESPKEAALKISDFREKYLPSISNSMKFIDVYSGLICLLSGLGKYTELSSLEGYTPLEYRKETLRHSTKQNAALQLVEVSSEKENVVISLACESWSDKEEKASAVLSYCLDKIIDLTFQVYYLEIQKKDLKK